MIDLKIGDEFTINYLYDKWKYNGVTGIITWLNRYKFYPNGDKNSYIYMWQGEITYPDGHTKIIGNIQKEVA